MATPDHTHPAHAPVSDLDRCHVLQQAIGAIAAIDHSSITGAVDELVAVAEHTGHAPLCVARQVLHLLDPTTHTGGHSSVVDAVRRRWAWPLHQLRHPIITVPERVWAIVLASATPTRPPGPVRQDRTLPAQRSPRLRGAAR